MAFVPEALSLCTDSSSVVVAWSSGVTLVVEDAGALFEKVGFRTMFLSSGSGNGDANNLGDNIPLIVALGRALAW